MYEHRIIGDKIMRVVVLEAADTRAASQHISAQPPISAAEQRVVREENER